MIDTHAHLDHLEDIDAALERASDAGVNAVIAVSEDLSSSKKNLAIKNRIENPKIYLGCGIHPSEAHKEDIETFLEFIHGNINEMTLIGEIGLDFWYRWARKDEDIKTKQRDVFRSLLKVAKEHHLPVSIHTRGAWEEAFSIVDEIQVAQGVFHWYSGPIDILEKILDKGFLISATPSLAYSAEAQAAIKEAPLDRILIETDTPVYYRNRETGDGFAAEPKDVWKTFDLLCELKQVNRQEMTLQMNKNIENLFGIHVKEDDRS